MTERHTATAENCLTSSPSSTTAPMLSSPTARPASTDLGFFSPSKSSKPVASTSSKVVVTTRISRKPVQPPKRTPPQTKPSTPVQSTSSSPLSSPLSSPPRKRKSPPASTPSESSAALPREVKRLRTASAKQKPRKRASAASSKASSRASSRQRTLASSPEPLYRIDRSRSASLFPLSDPEPPIPVRRWITEEDGTPGPHHFSSEMVVTRLVKSYKAYFRNPHDPLDDSFEPKNRPVVDLEYPNSNSSERVATCATCPFSLWTILAICNNLPLHPFQCLLSLQLLNLPFQIPFARSQGQRPLQPYYGPGKDSVYHCRILPYTRAASPLWRAP
ncbi:hypothetical protein BDN72DRAFT_1035 [Pluteus cervinus]|uniref:Uncharacterized protein n=1 Tax=Pluteus cervinus TaxID=181527 RepID=A0ACD3BF16_9AGAR|nr:hypothetical protein BDN72DRAFT_1035 [Pluteus cervinus]